MPVNQSANATLAGLTNGGQKLEVKVGGKTIESGQYIPRAEAQSAPEISLPSASGEYIVVSLDMDAPFVYFPVAGPILHWVQSGLKPSSTGTLSAESTPAVTPYVGPSPPPGSGPHRYCFFLYRQPADFDPNKYSPPHAEHLSLFRRMMNRVRFDLDAFEKDAKLGDILACNYFTSN